MQWDPIPGCTCWNVLSGLCWVIVRAPDTGGGLPACFCVDMLASTATLSLLLVAATGGFWAGVYGCLLSDDLGGLDGSRRVLLFLLFLCPCLSV